jgi:hypothetical protein
MAFENAAKKHSDKMSEVKEIMYNLQRKRDRDLFELKRIRKNFGLVQKGRSGSSLKRADRRIDCQRSSVEWNSIIESSKQHAKDALH